MSNTDAIAEHAYNTDRVSWWAVYLVIQWQNKILTY